MMYSLIVLSLIISILARGDFLGIIIGVYVFVLFVYKNNYEAAETLLLFLKINAGACGYDFLWLLFHYKGYWSGNEWEHSEIGLKRVTYFFSFLSFIVKVCLLVSVYMSYDKLGKNKDNSKRDFMKDRDGRKSIGMNSRRSIAAKN